MLKKFVEGLTFGAGFAIAVAAVWTVLSWLMTPKPMPRPLAESVAPSAQYQGDEDHSIADESPTTLRDDLNLSPEEQIAQARVIVIVEYQQAEDGRMQAIIAEFLKRAPDVGSFPGIGDEIRSASYYPGSGADRGDSALMFFFGSSLTHRRSMSVHGDRISGLGHMPLELFREKVAQAEQ